MVHNAMRGQRLIGDLHENYHHIHEELLNKARGPAGINSRTDLVSEGLRSLIERESARRLARLGASQPQLEEISCRRSEPA